MKLPVVFTYILMALTSVIPLLLYALISCQYLALMLGISEWIEIVVGVIFLESIWVGVLLFLMEERKKEGREKRAKLSRHYDGINKNVLTRWLSLSVNTVSYIEGFTTSMRPFYCSTSSIIKGEDTWHKWAMQHIYHEEGYPDLRSLFEKLESHEKNHNNFVSSLLKTLNDEVKSALRAFSNLKEYESGMADNFYHMENILSALHIYDVALEIFERELYLGKGTRIAKSNSETVLNLKGEIERIRATHKNDFEKIKVGIEKDEQLLNIIKSHVDHIIYELALEKPLKGECDYECSLDK